MSAEMSTAASSGAERPTESATGKPAEPAAGKAFDQSAPGDWRLLRAELRASTAYADALVDPGILTEPERDAIVNGLKRIEEEFARGEFQPTDGDLFTVVEARLLQVVGAVAGKLIAGRSRNEQVVTTLRLWLLDEIDSLSEMIANIQRALIQQAEAHVGTLMPGYTHFQPAQVVSASHWLLSYFWMLTRDQDRLAAAIGRASICPLGSGSLAGTPYPIDRRALAAKLGFSDVTANSMDAVGDLDFAAEFLFIAAMMGIHLSRLAEDLILYSNPALGFVTVEGHYTAGSALMPQKRNPNAVELSRGKAGRLLGDLIGFLSTLKGLPSTYNQDTQENRQLLFEAVDSLRAMLDIMEGVISTLTIHPDKMRAALNERILVSDLADYLVARGVSYRDAYIIVERLIKKADQQGTPISEMPLSEFQAESRAFDADVFAIFDYTRSAAQRATIGGTAPAAIRRQIRQALDWLMEAGLE